ncbi:hypothetical protein BN948_01674 [Hydrogenophaga intermedia]|jgi:hypothetical protein|uniref:Uncharacterized protein n=1 Tax=Hydrogenophaga intermedia TaxID=65786 RepID=A0A1L1PPI8_HYDIT|nr:hypothetical protein BN948_01674 [Hydrogenophaga intermedia]
MPIRITPQPSDSFRLLCLALCAVAALLATLTLLQRARADQAMLIDASSATPSSVCNHSPGASQRR